MITIEPRGLWYFETIQCEYYEDNIGRYWFKFILPHMETIKGPFEDRNVCYSKAFKYYQKEWVPF